MQTLSHNQEILLTRQRHEATRAGLHYDYRIVVGDKAFSWATKKEMPEPGQVILLHEQPVHTASYAMSERVEIPKGQYGAGVTTLDFVQKGKVINPEESDNKFVIHLNNGQEFLLRHVPGYSEKAWLFKNLTDTNNKYLEKAAMLVTQYHHPKTGKTVWVKENELPPKDGWVKTKHAKYIKRKT